MITELFSSILSILSSLFGLTFIVVFHEFGHFLFAKLFKVYTPTFSIGMGKKIFSKKIGDTDFCVSAAPIGGYVEIATEEGKDGSVGFNSIPYWQKFLITMGGIFFNIILTYLIFSLIFFVGAPESPMLPYSRNINKIESVSTESINHGILQAGDVFVSVNKTEINDDTQLLFNTVADVTLQSDMSEDREHKELHQATVLRDGKPKRVTLRINGYNAKFFSIPQYLEVELEKKAPLSIGASLKQSYSVTALYIKALARNLKSMFSGKNLDRFSGPIMIIAIGSKGAKKGIDHLLLLFAIISINLAIINLLPLPIFDGGQIVIFTIEALIGRQLSEKVQNIIGTSSWIFMLGLLAIFSLKDVYTLFFG